MIFPPAAGPRVRGYLLVNRSRRPFSSADSSSFLYSPVKVSLSA